MAKVKNTNKLWTVNETAQYFRRSNDTIYRWIGQKFIQEVIKVKDGYLIPVKEIKRLEKHNKIN